jgi:hypothetical protein
MRREWFARGLLAAEATNRRRLLGRCRGPLGGDLVFGRCRLEFFERHLKGYAGILQADAYAGFNRLYEAGRKPGPITEAACWAHGWRKLFVLADITAKVCGKLSVVAPLALAAIKRIDATLISSARSVASPPTNV